MVIVCGQIRGHAGVSGAFGHKGSSDADELQYRNTHRRSVSVFGSGSWWVAVMIGVGVLD
jgi:hypothetical protein